MKLNKTERALQAQANADKPEAVTNVHNLESNKHAVMIIKAAEQQADSGEALWAEMKIRYPKMGEAQRKALLEDVKATYGESYITAGAISKQRAKGVRITGTSQTIANAVSNISRYSATLVKCTEHGLHVPSLSYGEAVALTKPEATPKQVTFADALEKLVEAIASDDSALSCDDSGVYALSADYITALSNIAVLVANQRILNELKADEKAMKATLADNKAMQLVIKPAKK